MKKNTAYFVATLACLPIVIIWVATFSLEMRGFWMVFITGGVITIIGFTWRAITDKPKRKLREEAVKNIDYNKEVLIRIDEEIEKVKRSGGREISHDLIWILENQCTSKQAALDLIEKYAQAFNKDLIKRIENISDIIPEIKVYLDPLIDAGIVEAKEQLMNQEILKNMNKKSTKELTEILKKHDTSIYKEETFDIIKYILEGRNSTLCK